LQDNEKKINSKLAEQQKVCCDENTPCVPNDNNNSNEEKMMNVDTGNYNNNDYVDSHRGENRHSKDTREEKESDNKKLISNLKSRIKEDKLEEQYSILILIYKYKT
jgi:hypothetical protein